VMSSFFFFQAEDGIRDHCVTGVQTCALPIWTMKKKRNNSWKYQSTTPVRQDTELYSP